MIHQNGTETGTRNRMISVYSIFFCLTVMLGSGAHDGLFSLSIQADVTDPIINVPYSLLAKDKNGLVSRGWPELTTTEKRGEQPQ